MAVNGAVLAILGACFFGLNRIFVRRAVIRIPDAEVGVLVSVPLSLPLFLIILVITGRVYDIVSFSWQSYVWLSLAGITHFVAGRMFNYIAVQLIGANISSVLLRVAPIVATAIGISLLGEPLTWEIVVGVLLIVCGAGVVSWNPKMPDSGNNQSSNLPTKGILFSLGTGFFFGLSPVFIKLGLYDSYSPVAATFISYFAATIVLSAFLLSRGKRAALFGMGSRLVLSFYFAGLLTSIAQLLRYAALSISPVSVVSPLFSTSPIFVFVFSFLLNRKVEVFNTALIIGVIITVIGAVLLA